MSSTEWRSPQSVLHWCRTTLVVAGAMGASGCGHWVPGGKLSTVYGPVAVSEPPSNAKPPRAECERLCAQYAEATGVCELATLALTPATRPGGGAAVPARGSTVVICEVDVPGEWESESILPTPFGRRPLEPRAADAVPRTEREHFERAAAHEAAAVRAFHQLAFDLEELGAPASIVAEARLAARDEANHARWTLAVARSFDPCARLGPVDERRAARRKLTPFALALDNAAAGCVGELFGTWLQIFQARAAATSLLRSTAERIAQDEARHAALAFRLFDWLDRRLGARERELVRMAMRSEVRLLASTPMLSDDLAIRLGLPDSDQMARAARALRDRLPVACA